MMIAKPEDTRAQGLADIKRKGLADIKRKGLADIKRKGLADIKRKGLADIKRTCDAERRCRTIPERDNGVSCDQLAIKRVGISRRWRGFLNT